MERAVGVTGSRNDRKHLYDQLNPTVEQIRLLTPVYCSDGSSELCFSLSTHRLEDAPSYKAVSYEWGCAEVTHQVQVNGAHVSIRDNLWLFLDMMRTSRTDPEPVGFLWIDQICINQMDLGERARQVQLMGQIFSSASRVLGWLGTSSDPAFQNMGLTIRKMVVAMGPMMVSLIRRSKPELWRAVSTALRALARLSYWSRLWIMQEIVVARDITFYLNRENFGAEDLLDLMRSYNYESIDPSPDFEMQDHMIALLDFRIVRQYRSHPSIWTCIDRSFTEGTNIQCSDPHDLIYGLIGISQPLPGLQVDYALPTQELFGNILDLLLPAIVNRRPVKKDSCFDGGGYWPIHSIFLLTKVHRLAVKLGVPRRWFHILHGDNSRYHNYQGISIIFERPFKGFTRCLEALRLFGLYAVGLDTDEIHLVMAKAKHLGKLTDWKKFSGVDYVYDWTFISGLHRRKGQPDELYLSRLQRLVEIARDAKIAARESRTPFTLPDIPLDFAMTEPVYDRH